MNIDMHDLAQKLLSRWDGASRMLVAIAGPPGSGKSTLAQKLRPLIDQVSEQNLCVVVPMDGFHKSNEELDRLSLRWCKGAPQTFNSNEFVSLIREIRNEDRTISIPLFDRDLDSVVEHAMSVDPQHKIILIEGNYLLLQEEPWHQLTDLFDFTVFIQPSMETLERRLVQRWVEQGYTEPNAVERAKINDIPNAALVLEHSGKSDLLLQEA